LPMVRPTTATTSKWPWRTSFVCLKASAVPLPETGVAPGSATRLTGSREPGDMGVGLFERVRPRLYRLTPYGRSAAAGDIDLDHATRTIGSRVSSPPTDLEQLLDKTLEPSGRTQTTSRPSSAPDADIKNMGRQRERSKRSNVSSRSIPGTRSLQTGSASCDGNQPRTGPLQADWCPMKWRIAFAYQRCRRARTRTLSECQRRRLRRHSGSGPSGYEAPRDV